MQGNEQVIKLLNDLLSAELTAIDQYFIHSRMYEDWGLTKLYEHTAHETEHEKEHAGMLIERILFLEGTPDMITRTPLRVGKTVREMLQNDLQLEYDDRQMLVDAIKAFEAAQDYVSRELAEKLLDDTEMDHAYWLEKQLKQIEMIGEQNYIQSQLA
ncbi:bacterioferritin [Salinibius halmophilus]|uniref:bacterioferritin n=1 Tax=Salinibius halmophilus TaxID=1853216 RepID=UPI000E66D8CA|nr:bacterioferritin [Salinibius halmophilus]